FIGHRHGGVTNDPPPLISDGAGDPAIDGLSRRQECDQNTTSQNQNVSLQRVNSSPLDLCNSIPHRYSSWFALNGNNLSSQPPRLGAVALVGRNRPPWAQPPSLGAIALLGRNRPPWAQPPSLGATALLGRNRPGSGDCYR